MGVELLADWLMMVMEKVWRKLFPHSFASPLLETARERLGLPARFGLERGDYRWVQRSTWRFFFAFWEIFTSSCFDVMGKDLPVIDVFAIARSEAREQSSMSMIVQLGLLMSHTRF